MLILCHPKIVTGSFELLRLHNHWYGFIPDTSNSIFNQLFTEYNLNGNPVFETVDIISDPKNYIKVY